MLDEASFNLQNNIIVDCSMRLATLKIDVIERRIDSDDIIAISGGGWLGTEWKQHEDFVRNILFRFPNNRIIIFPQTAFYHNDDAYLHTGANIYSKHPNLYFCARDYDTYELYKSNSFINERRLLYMPDMALYSNVWEHNSVCIARNGVGLCLRDDREAQISESERIQIENSIMKKYECITIRTNEVEKTIRPWRRDENILRKLKEIAGLQLLVTDRLHAMVMAAITNTPCIALDNSTHKVAGVYTWIKDLDYIYLINNISEVRMAIDNMLTKKCNKSFKDWDESEYLNILSVWFSTT